MGDIFRSIFAEEIVILSSVVRENTAFLTRSTSLSNRCWCNGTCLSSISFVACQYFRFLQPLEWENQQDACQNLPNISNTAKHDVKAKQLINIF